MTLDAHITGIWCGQIGGGVGRIRDCWFFGARKTGRVHKNFSVSLQIIGA